MIKSNENIKFDFIHCGHWESETSKTKDSESMQLPHVMHSLIGCENI